MPSKERLSRVYLLLFAISSLMVKDINAINDTEAEGDVSDSNEDRNDINDSDNLVDIDIVEKDTDKKSLEVYFRRKENDVLYNNAEALQAIGAEDSPEKEDDRSSIKLTLYPFAVSIQNKGLHYATAALLSYKWIISSAADFYNVRESIRMLRARLGSIDCKRGGVVKRIREIYIHPQFKKGIPNYDLALLNLSTAATYDDDIQPIAIAPVGENRDLVGSFLSPYWARLLNDGAPLKDTAAERVKETRLRVSKKTTIPFSECYYNLSRRNTTLETTTFCYNPFINFHTPCMPDSGAPIVVNNELWGVTSSWTGEDCSEHNTYPTFATRLTAPSIRTWILDTMANIE